MTLPNFLVIGAPKAGTTSLHLHLRAHPAIFMPELKEPRFFGYEGEGERLKFPIRTLEEYTALFDAVTDETAIGEATPHYLVYPGAAQRIHDLMPERAADRLAARPGRAVLLGLPDEPAQSRGERRRALRRGDADRPQPARDLRRHAGALFRAVPGRAAQGDPARGSRDGRRRRRCAGSTASSASIPASCRDLSKIANPGGEPRNKLLHGLLSDPRLRQISRGVPAAPRRSSGSGRCAAATSRSSRSAPEDRRAAIGFFRDDILRTQDLIGRDLSSWLRA